MAAVEASERSNTPMIVAPLPHGLPRAVLLGIRARPSAEMIALSWSQNNWPQLVPSFGAEKAPPEVPEIGPYD